MIKKITYFLIFISLFNSCRKYDFDTSTIENKEWFSSHDEKLKQLQSSDDSINISRAYKLLQQDEVIRDNYDKFWTDLKRIENK